MELIDAVCAYRLREVSMSAKALRSKACWDHEVSGTIHALLWFGVTHTEAGQIFARPGAWTYLLHPLLATVAQRSGSEAIRVLIFFVALQATFTQVSYWLVQ